MTFGWWRSFEHYCVPGSTPVAISADIKTVEGDLRRQVDGYDKLPVVAEMTDADWQIGHKATPDDLVKLTAPQARKYDAARRGGPRGNLGPIPPTAETSKIPIDLDNIHTTGNIHFAEK